MYPDETPDEFQTRQEYTQFVAEVKNYLVEIVADEYFVDDETPSTQELYHQTVDEYRSFVDTMDEFQNYHPHLWVDVIWYGTEPSDWTDRLLIEPDDSARQILQRMAYEVFLNDLRTKIAEDLAPH